MGRKYAPSAANILLSRFDHQAMNGFHIKPELYSRFWTTFLASGQVPGKNS